MSRKSWLPAVSIRSALLLILAAALAPAFHIIAVTGADHARHMEEQAAAEALRQAAAFGDIQLRITESTRQMLAVLSALPAFRDRNSEIAERILKAVHEENPEYLNFSLTDGDGLITASSLLARGTDLSNRPHVRRALLSGRYSTGEYLLGLVQSEPSFSYSLPLLDGAGRPYGTINTLYKLSSYASLFEDFELDPESFLGIVDRKGIRIFFYPPKDTNPIGKPVKAEVWRRIQEGDDSGTFLDVSSDGVVRFYGYRRLRLEGDPVPYITVVYAVPRERILAVSRSITVRNLSAMAVAALVALALAWVLSELLFGRRLSRIGAAVDRIRGGDLGARVGFSGDGSDLGRIAGALDGMAEAVQRRDLEKEEETRRLQALVEEKQVLLKEVHHRVKNNLQMTLSLIRLQEGISAEGGELSLKGLESRISAMAMVHEMLYSSENLTYIDLCEYCTQLLELLRSSYAGAGSVQVSFACETVHCPLESAIPFGLLLSELVTNAIKHSSGRKSTTVSVVLGYEDGKVLLIVSDNGPGLPEGFDPGKSRGLGLQLAVALAGQLGGKLAWENAGGARFRVEFPLMPSCDHEET
jgi:two-component sensor histidine kinase